MSHPARPRLERGRRHAPSGVRVLFTDAARPVHDAVADRGKAGRMPQRADPASAFGDPPRRGIRHPSARAPRRSARGAVIALAVALALATPLLSACAAPADGASGRQSPSTPASSHSPGADAATSPGSAPEPASAPESFRGGATPTPEATITPVPGSWDAASVPANMRLVVISADSDPGTLVLIDAVTAWAADHRARVSTLAAPGPDALDAALTEALGSAPDLVVGVGRGVVDVFALETAQFLDQQFLVLGAQLAEPTENVTAVVWPGAAFRGSGISAEDAATADAVTAERARDAVSAGVASVVWNLTGIVIQLE